jgi:hypothetical protein
MLFKFALIVKVKLAEQDAGGRGAMGDKYGKSLAHSLQNVILLAKRITDELMKTISIQTAKEW